MAGTSTSSGDGNPAPAREYARLFAELDWMRSFVEARAGASWWTGAAALDQLTDGAFLRARVDAARELYPMPDAGRSADRYQTQVWWYSTCNAWMGPAAASIVVQGSAPAPDWDATTLIARDGYWLAFSADSFVEVADLGALADLGDLGDLADLGADESARGVRAYGAALGAMAQPVVDAIGAELGVRPAPLWAILVDAVAAAAVAAGNEVMEPEVGQAVATGLVAGIGEVVRVPSPRFAVVERDFDEVTHLVRSSCCMIYHCPDADLCVSCPRRPEDQRRELWAGA